MKMKTIDGQLTEIKNEEIEGLRTSIKGQVLCNGDAGYEDNRTVWNAMVDRSPAVVVRCLGTVDVISCVRFSRKHNLLICIKGGGHNVAGLATADDAMMIDMSLMRGVWVDPVNRVAHAQAGCLIGDIDRETQIHGLATVLGFISQTGVTGLTLGGGFGYLTRRWGWTTDNVRGFEMVTAEGQLVRVTENENTDLFWALRGGGGNFGIVTRIDYSLFPIGPEITGGMIVWEGEESERVLDFYRRYTLAAPPELTLVAIMRPAPRAPFIPETVQGKPVVILLGCYTGDPGQAEKVLSPIRNLGKPVADIITRRPYTQLQTLLDAGQPKGRRNYWKSEYLPGIAPDMIKKIIPYTEKFPSPNSLIVLFHIGGALNKFTDEHSATGNRNARFVLNIPSAWDTPGEDGKNISWVRSVWEDLRSYSTGGNYINFQSLDEDQDRVEAAFGRNMKRLSEIKAIWDPQNIFRMNRNIVPAKVMDTF